MGQERKIDFIIVGAMKSGTTTLGHHLGRHPRVCIPGGEVHFFDDEHNFKKGLSWYERRLLARMTDQTTVVGEKTAAYAYHPEAAKRIFEVYPDIKLVWVFREPVSRAYSHYLHAFRNGAIRFSFEEAIDAEPALLKKSIYFGYTKRSRYAEQVERYLEYFSKERMHFMLFEDFVNNTAGQLEKLFDFIGVSTEGFVYRDDPRGKTTMPRWQTSVWAARKIGGTGPLWRAVMFANVFLKSPGYPKLDTLLRERLKAGFLEDNERLAEITGLDLGAWR